MTQNTEVTLSKGGTRQRTIKAGTIHIPDLWSIATNLRKSKEIGGGEESSDRILKVWQLCHDLLNHILFQPD